MLETSDNLTSLNIIFKTKTNPTFIPHRLFLKVLLFSQIPHLSHISVLTFLHINIKHTIPHLSHIKSHKKTISHINPTFQIKKWCSVFLPIPSGWKKSSPKVSIKLWQQYHLAWRMPHSKTCHAIIKCLHVHLKLQFESFSYVKYMQMLAEALPGLLPV